MVSGPQKPHNNTPWRTDGRALYGKDKPAASWQLPKVDAADDGVTEPPSKSKRQKSDARDSFGVRDDVRALAEEGWRSGRQLFRHLWDPDYSPQTPSAPSEPSEPNAVDDESPLPSTTPEQNDVDFTKVDQWLNTVGRERHWVKVVEFFGHPALLTHLVEVVWEKKYHSPMPDEIVFMVYKNSTRSYVVARRIDVFPKSEVDAQALHKQYTNHAILVLRRNPDKTFVAIRPIFGSSAVQLFNAALQSREDVTVSSVADQRLAIKSAGGILFPKSDAERLSWNDFLIHVRENAKNLIAGFSDIHATVDLDAELLPEKVALVVLQLKGFVYPIRMMSWEAAEKLCHEYSVVFLERYSALNYVPTRIRGAYTMDVVVAVLQGLEILPQEPLVFEKLLLAGILRDSSAKDAPPQPWNNYLDYMASLKQDLWDRMYVMFKATHRHGYEEEETPNLWLLFDRKLIDKAAYISRFEVSDHDDSKRLGAVELAHTETGMRIMSLRGTGALDVALKLLNNLGLEVQGPIETGMIAGTLDYDIIWPDPKTSPTWNGWVSYVSQRGLQGTFKRARQIFEHVHMGEGSPDDLVILGRRKGTGNDAVLRNIKVVTLEESRRYEKDLSIMKIRFHRTPNGDDVLVNTTGVGGKETETVGVQVFAPDATQMDEQARKLASYGPENFGNLDGQFCKPKPLFTPAELLKTPPLVRPVDAIDLPRVGGFQTTDPEAAKNFATPPTITRPSGPVSEKAALVALEILAAGVMFYLTRGALPPQPSFGAGGLMVSPQNRWESEEI